MKVLALLPAKNEERMVRWSILSVINQVRRPDCFLLVDDESSDSTPEIMKEFAAGFDWIHYFRVPGRRERNVGAGVARALILGVRFGEAACLRDWDLLIKVDADTVLERGYIAKIVERFERDPKLGIASGFPVGEPPNPDHARGMGMSIRRDVWVEARLKPILGWDSYLVFKARMLGWRVRSFSDIKMFLMRPTSVSEGSLHRGKFKQGFTSGFLGYPPFLLIGRAARNALSYGRPGVFVAMVAGYLSARINYPEPVDPEVKEWLRMYEVGRLRSFASRILGP